VLINEPRVFAPLANVCVLLKLVEVCFVFVLYYLLCSFFKFVFIQILNLTFAFVICARPSHNDRPAADLCSARKFLRASQVCRGVFPAGVVLLALENFRARHIFFIWHCLLPVKIPDYYTNNNDLFATKKNRLIFF
jgi:hypothetical protein